MSLRPFFEVDRDFICIYSYEIDSLNIWAFQIGSILTANNAFMKTSDGDDFLELLVLFHGFGEETIKLMMEGHSTHATYEKAFLVAKNYYPDFLKLMKFHRIKIKDREISKKVWRRLHEKDKKVIKKIGHRGYWKFVITESTLKGCRDEVITSILSEEEKIIKKNGGIKYE